MMAAQAVEVITKIQLRPQALAPPGRAMQAAQPVRRTVAAVVVAVLAVLAVTPWPALTLAMVASGAQQTY